MKSTGKDSEGDVCVTTNNDHYLPYLPFRLEHTLRNLLSGSFSGSLPVQEELVSPGFNCWMNTGKYRSACLIEMSCVHKSDVWWLFFARKASFLLINMDSLELLCVAHRLSQETQTSSVQTSMTLPQTIDWPLQLFVFPQSTSLAEAILFLLHYSEHSQFYSQEDSQCCLMFSDQEIHSVWVLEPKDEHRFLQKHLETIQPAQDRNCDSKGTFRRGWRGRWCGSRTWICLSMLSHSSSPNTDVRLSFCSFVVCMSRFYQPAVLMIGPIIKTCRRFFQVLSLDGWTVSLFFAQSSERRKQGSFLICISLHTAAAASASSFVTHLLHVGSCCLWENQSHLCCQWCCAVLSEQKTSNSE